MMLRGSNKNILEFGILEFPEIPRCLDLEKTKKQNSLEISMIFAFHIFHAMRFGVSIMSIRISS